MIRPTLLGLSVLALLGCAEADPVEPTLVSIQEGIFDRSCASSSCHGSAASGELDLRPGTAHGQLVGVAPDDATAQGAGLLRVDPGNPENSQLYLILTEQYEEAGSNRMPRNVIVFLDDEKVEAVRQWIADGAPAE